MTQGDVNRTTYVAARRTTNADSKRARYAYSTRTTYVLLACLLFGTTLDAQVQSEGPVASAVRAISSGAAKATAAQRRQPAKRRSVRRTPVRTARSPATVGPAFTSPRTASALAMDLGTILRSRTRGGTWGVVVTSVTRGDTLFSTNPDVLLKPASIMKMMTTGLALERFGPEHTFATTVLREVPVTAG